MAGEVRLYDRFGILVRRIADDEIGDGVDWGRMEAEWGIPAPTDEDRESGAYVERRFRRVSDEVFIEEDDGGR